MWEAKLNNGEYVKEGSHEWSEIKNKIDKLYFTYKDMVYELPKADEYIQYKTASASLFGGEINVESQTIGIKTNEKKMILKFDFRNNKVIVSFPD